MGIRDFEGTCRYCGQMVWVRAADQADADNEASEKCNCKGCFLEQRLDRAQEAIDKLFGQGCKSSGLQEASDDAVELIKITAAAINREDIVSATINLGGCKAVLSQTSDEKIKIVRADSARLSQEA